MLGDGIFQILHRDGAGRVGKLSTKRGDITTPTLMPVIDPSNLILTPNQMREEFGVEIIITNAYLVMRRFGERAAEEGIHKILDFDGPIMTDSGGYQVLRYGGIDVTPEQMVKYQDSIAPDIATILDLPTGIDVSREQAIETVETTLARAREALKLRSNPEVMWCGPIQGGTHLDLVERCAKEMGKLNYHLYAIGSPVELLENYRYPEVVDLVMTAKRFLPLERPVHLFGAGHPMMLPLAVIMGCDLFDSAAYALYARDGRYMTPTATLRLEELDWLPCECPVCLKHSAQELKEAPPEKRSELLARHNLYITFGELKRVKQAIVEGRLWEHVEQRCRSHPRLLDGFRRLGKHGKFLERFDPVTKPSAFYYLGPESAHRPEVIRYRSRLRERYVPPKTETLVLAPWREEGFPPLPEQAHLVWILPPFGVIPEELEGLYPLGQHQIPEELDEQQVQIAVHAVKGYLQKHGKNYRQIVLFDDPDRWGDALVKACSQAKEKLQVRRFK